VRAAGLATLLLLVLAPAAAAQAPPNDAFGSAAPIGAPGGEVRGTNVGATAEPGEPPHAGSRRDASVWYRFTAGSDIPGLVVDACEADFDDVLAVYTGGPGITQLTEVASVDDNCGSLGAQVTIPVRAGSTYFIAVSGFGGSTGQFVLRTRLAGVGVSVANEGGVVRLRGSGRFTLSAGGGSLFFSSEGTGIAAGSGCRGSNGSETGRGTATCSLAGVTAVEAVLGPGDDAFSAQSGLPVPLTVLGGAGNDELGGPPGDDRTNAAGVRLFGGEGADQIRGSGAGNTLVDAGPGDDAVFAPAGGVRGSVLRILGGSGADRVVAGNSELREEVEAGPGDDTIDVAEGGGDSVACGDGADTAVADASGPARDELSGCETTITRTPDFGRSVVLEVSRGIVRFARSARAQLRRLRGEREVRLDSAIDATRGTVQLASAPPSATGRSAGVAGALGALSGVVRGVAQVAAFSAGAFEVDQRRSTGTTELRVRGRLRRCRRYPPGRGAPFRRRVRGDGQGAFRIVGQRASASLRPAEDPRNVVWTVEDRCDGSTRVSVQRGSVEVDVRGGRQNVVVRAGRRLTTPRRR